MKIAIPKETMPGETRVAMLPSEVKRLKSDDIAVLVEAGAGAGSFVSDADYEAVGAQIVSDIYPEADVVVKVNPPTDDELGKITDGTTLISLLAPFTNHDGVKSLSSKKVTSFCLELIPRTTYAQSMDVLSSQATVGGYRAVLNAANHLGKFFPMLMTPAGTIKPSTVLVIGAGVAGLQAIATASRLGAKVEAFDVRPAAREQVESLGAKFLYMDLDESSETDSGYAIEMDDEFIRKEMELLHDAAKRVDAIITTALIFGKKAPILIKDYMVEDMHDGSCIIDMAAENGGNCELTEPGKVVTKHGVVIDGSLNLPSEVPVHASQMFSKNIAKLLSDIIKEDKLEVDFENEVTKGCVVTHNGEIVHEMTKKIIEGAK
ncbi:MAG: Re/Si-specific NAD(P)(+) transhydrogenase subunit alpha [Candidatus Marinimicrobia bacterium]|nr:Re/Si-specific NAD(P)(+) transhydrogenase subunit alpha [Candidatus Neomarinimicrobiota bacterium]MBL7023535.1 Re/Si-specific NAD(P)(+) transhydrogenase subunit alpha [Candidatus Neomarinimicrobiota bacterium]MBL7109559.1 Re/Si-specific NAD(P)(+) transhydrogenase subunit alpha [Candidatus Neomarinimicrobiota bacterium]